MAKKVNMVFKATLTKNMSKGGSWLACVKTNADGMDNSNTLTYNAWSNASAGKRWIKEMVISMTTRKSVKMLPGTELDAKGKPIAFSGELVYKVDA
jgi:hypothetical protein